MSTCIFCKIVAGEIPATIIGRSDHAVAFRDVNPQAPTHVLVVPISHIASVAETDSAEGQAIVSEVVRLAVKTAKELGLEGPGYRLVMNHGDHGGQSVHHLHVHLLGGRRMHWPPG
jgi:histidine triad (HIT) family protein